MSKIICDEGDLVAIADAVRRKTGKTNEMTLGEIVTNIENLGSTQEQNFAYLEIPASGLGYELYYTNQNGNFVSVELSEYLSLKVLKNSIIYCTYPIFDDETYPVDNLKNVTKISNNAISISYSVTLEYADGAPRN